MPQTVPKYSSQYILFGRRRKEGDIEISSSSEVDGFTVSPAVSYDYSGRSVSNAGDINGDGYDDLIIGVPYASRCYVLFGTAKGFVNMTDGFTVFGPYLFDGTGWSVNSAGDVNNDTFVDIIIGAPYGSSSGVAGGAVYVLYGRQNDHYDIYLKSLQSYEGIAVYGATESDALGLSVSGAGDFNGDGYDDIVIGALKQNSYFQGGAYVIYGSNSSLPVIYLRNLQVSQGFTMTNSIWSWSGYSVSGAGDVNGDGFDDVLIGSVPFRTTFGTQMTYLIYGNNDTTTVALSLSALTKQQGVVISGGGVVVHDVGDINHDGYDDIMIGSHYGFTGAGFVVYTEIRPKMSQAPTMSPATLPMSKPPSKIPTREPTTAPSKGPSPQPSIKPTFTPTEKQTGPSEPPTEAPTGPTSTPTSTPTISTEQPSSSPTTSQPTSRPTSEPTPTSAPSTRPSIPPLVTTEPPTMQPTVVSEYPTPQVTVKPSTQSPTVKKPSFRSRYPIFVVPSYRPTRPQLHTNFLIVVGGYYEKQSDIKTNYIVATSETVHITSEGSLEGDIYTVLPQVNGSLYIEIFNNISDKLNLTSHSTVQSISDLVITRGSVIITFPTTRQRVRLANLTPLDISENNFVFTKEKFVSPPMAWARRVAIVFISYIVGAAILVYILKIARDRYRDYKARMRHLQECQIALEDNPTRLCMDRELSNIEFQQLTDDIEFTLFWNARDSQSAFSSDSNETKSNESNNINSSNNLHPVAVTLDFNKNSSKSSISISSFDSNNNSIEDISVSTSDDDSNIQNRNNKNSKSDNSSIVLSSLNRNISDIIYNSDNKSISSHNSSCTISIRGDDDDEISQQTSESSSLISLRDMSEFSDDELLVALTVTNNIK